MSERLFAALYCISHGVSKLAPSQNIVSVTDLLVLQHPNKRIGYVSPTTVKYYSKFIPLALNIKIYHSLVNSFFSLRR